MSMHPWTRRQLLQSAAVAVAARPLVGLSQASPLEASACTSFAVGSIAYATRPSPEHEGTAELHVLQRQHTGWQQVQQLAAKAPAAAVLDDAGHYLYVAHTAERTQGSPAGRVEVYRVTHADGRIHLHAEQQLALAATRPVTMALSPQGNLLIVASNDGVFSVLPVLPNGQLQPVSAAYKDLSLATADGTVEAMRFMPCGDLTVTSDGSARHFACTAEGMRLTGTAIASNDVLPAAFPAALEGFPHLRCLAMTQVSRRNEAQPSQA